MRFRRIEEHRGPFSAKQKCKVMEVTPIYGRHAALRPMRELEHADLICFGDNSVAGRDHVPDHLHG